jgi:hypothetical protein
MSDLSIGSVRWVNATTGESGAGTVAHVQECLFLLGCGTWSRLVVVVPLITGVNTCIGITRATTASGATTT